MDALRRVRRPEIVFEVSSFINYSHPLGWRKLEGKKMLIGTPRASREQGLSSSATARIE